VFRLLGLALGALLAVVLMVKPKLSQVSGFWRFKIHARVPSVSAALSVRSHLARVATSLCWPRWPVFWPLVAYPLPPALSAPHCCGWGFLGRLGVSRPCCSAAPSLSCSATCAAWVNARRVRAGPCAAASRSVATRARHALLGLLRTSWRPPFPQRR
jgi:hypothetical protein